MEVLHGMMEQIERQRLSKMMDEMPDNVTMQQRCSSLCFVLAENVHEFNPPLLCWATSFKLQQ